VELESALARARIANTVVLKFLAQMQHQARGPTEGRVIYAVGDVHGRSDLLDRLLERIRRDAAPHRGASKPVLIFIGDYVDRGPLSREVLDRVVELKREGEFEVRALKGNHEAAMLAFLRNAEGGLTWCERGGAETLASYGVTPPESATDAAGWNAARDALELALPLQHLNLLLSLELTVTYGDYIFVHAGLRPGVALSAQTEDDLLWIRDDFMNVQGAFEKVVVHGHTSMEQASMDDNRINIDTGAYASGVLTAVRLENEERRFIQAGTIVPRATRDAATGIAPPATEAPALADGDALSGLTFAFSIALLVMVVLVIRGSGARPAVPEADAAVAATAVGPVFTPASRSAVGPATRSTVAARPRPVDSIAPSSSTVIPSPPTTVPPTNSAPAVAVLPPPKSAGVTVQIGAFPSEARVNTNWRELRDALPDELAGRAMTIEAGVSGGRTVYRGVVGGFASRSDALKFCAALSSAGRPCFVRTSQRRGSNDVG
jgi:serine/threonine protein phosphatase 1